MKYTCKTIGSLRKNVATEMSLDTLSNFKL